MSTTSCGSWTPCAVFFTTNTISPKFNFSYTWNFTIIAGYNKLLLDSPVLVNKGSFIYLNQVTGKIAVDKTGNAAYSEMYLNGAAYYRLNELSNWRLYINALTSFSSYKSNFTVIHSYAFIGAFDLSLTFTSSNQTFNFLAFVTQCNLLKIKNKILNKFYLIIFKLTTGT